MSTRVPVELITPVEITAELDRTVGANVKGNYIIIAPESNRRFDPAHR